MNSRPWTPRPPVQATAVLALALLLAPSPCRAGSEKLALRLTSLDLPGAPSKVISTDVDGDGHADLVIVVAYTEFQEIGGDRIENLVQISTVIPALFDRREVRYYRAHPPGGYTLEGEPLELPTTVLHLEPGPAGVGLIALTDDGLARLAIRPGGDGPTLSLHPLIADRPVLAHTGSFYASLQLVHDLDGDGDLDVLFPSRKGLSIYLGDEQGIATTPVQRIEIAPAAGSRTRLWYPLPEVAHVNGDDLPDLIFENGLGGGSPRRMQVLLGSGGGRFEPLRALPRDCHDSGSDLRVAGVEPDLEPWPRNLVALRDLDGDHRAEVITSLEKERGDGFRAGMKDAKRPIQDYGFHELDLGLDMDPEPYFRMKVIGHTVGAELQDEGFPFRVKTFEDLGGDGREDLVSVTLDFSIFQAVKILATKKIGIGIDFHVYCQQEDGTFREVPGLDLSEKLKLDLNNLRLGRFAQFAGDFDGDGRQDFVHLGRGRRVTLHRGGPGCRFPKNPDLVIELEEEPLSLDLVRIADLDGDGRSDLMITRPLEAASEDVSPPVRLDLYLSGGGS